MHNVASSPCCRSRRRSNSSAIRGKANSQATTQIRRKCPELTKSSNCQMHDVPSSTRTPPVDNTDWLKTVAIIAVAIGHFGQFFMENDHWWAVSDASRLRHFSSSRATRRAAPSRSTGYGSVLSSLCSIAGTPTGDGWHRTSPELRADPPRTSVRTKLCAASRLGRRCRARLRTYRRAPAGGEGCRLRCGGLAVGPVWLIPAPAMADQRSAQNKSRHRLRAG